MNAQSPRPLISRTSLFPVKRTFFIPSEAARNTSLPNGSRPGTMKITSSVIRLSTVFMSPLWLAVIQVDTSSRIARSSSVMASLARIVPHAFLLFTASFLRRRGFRSARRSNQFQQSVLGFCRIISFGFTANDIVSHHGAANPFERKLADRFNPHSLVNRQQNAWADENLTGLGFIAKSRGDVRHCPNRGIVEATLETDRAECREPVAQCRYQSLDHDRVCAICRSRRRWRCAYPAPSERPVARDSRPGLDH